MHTLGSVCPLLTTFHIQGSYEDNGHFLQVVVELLPSLLPKVLELGIQCGVPFPLLDMSGNPGIQALEMLHYTITGEEQWLRLPPDLHRLRCRAVNVGPPAAAADGSKVCLGSLQELALRCSAVGPSLQVLSSILQAAPELQTVHCDCFNPNSQGMSIQCPLGPSTAAQFSVLHGQMKSECLQKATFVFRANEADREASLQPVIASLPCMTDVASCEMHHFRPQDAVSLLGVLPDLGRLSLAFVGEFDDVTLQAVGSKAKLTHLTLTHCPNITPAGVLALCVRLPQLESVTYTECPLLSQPALSSLLGLLRACGSVVWFTHKPEALT